MLFEHEMTHLEDMNEDLSLALDTYMFDRLDDYIRDKEAVTKFVQYVIEENNKAIDELRGKSGRTYRQAAKYP